MRISTIEHTCKTLLIVITAVAYLGFFSTPAVGQQESGAIVEEAHLLIGGNIGNVYLGEIPPEYAYLIGTGDEWGEIYVTFNYEDSTSETLSVSIPWDWSSPPGDWTGAYAYRKYVGVNPVRCSWCTMFEAGFINPNPAKRVVSIKVNDDWVGGYPWSDVFALTVKSPDVLKPTTWYSDNSGYYFLEKDDTNYFNGIAPGGNNFPEYSIYNGIKFYTHGNNDWTSYGRMDLSYDGAVIIDIARAGTIVEEAHLMIGGNIGNVYLGEIPPEYAYLIGTYDYWGEIYVTFNYEDSTSETLSVSIPWDWSSPPGDWTGAYAYRKYVGSNPMRCSGCTMFEAGFMNPNPAKRVVSIKVNDDWVGGYPWSDVFALTVKSPDVLKPTTWYSDNSGYYFLEKDDTNYFNGIAPGGNNFPEYSIYNGIKFYTHGNNDWTSYGRMDLSYDGAVIIDTVPFLPSDTTPPATTIALSGTPGNNGWYTSDVQVTLTATDNEGGSGVKNTEYSFDGTNWNTYITPFSITDEGVTTIYYRSTDNAGNVEETKSQTVNFDKTPPQVTINTPANGGVYVLNQPLTADWTAIDSLSGIASAAGTLPSGAAIDTSMAGTKTFTVTATDIASNTATQTVSYTIAYDFFGILPPIKTDGSSIFNLGRTVPVKFRIADANGNYVSTATASLTYQKITDEILGTVEEAVSTSAASEGNTFRYDSTDDLYIFNLGTEGMSTGTYQLNINLDDGTVHTVRISLR